jgi:carboxypeptidase PM20D1
MRRIAKRVLRGMATALVVLVVVLVANTLRKAPPPRTPVMPEASFALDEGALAEHLSAAVRIATTSHEDTADDDPAAFAALRELLERTYPKMHATLGREAAGERALLYTWTGADPSLAPVLFAAHMDVVPVEADTRERWTHPPHDGRIEGGFVWGRGTLDDKASLVGLCEAVEALLGEGFRPKRTVYLAFGADEEVGGHRGAEKIAALLAARGVHLEFVLDEGMVVTEGIVPDVAGQVALIGTCEKGYVSVELVATDAGGHSSMPPHDTAIDLLATALARLHDDPMPARLQGAPRMMLERVAPELPFAKRVLLSNLWLTEPLVVRSMAKAPSTNAAIRTTTAPTILQSGLKDNVLPTSARAVVNFRIAPGDTVAAVVAHVTAAVADPRVRVKQLGPFASDPSPEAPTETRAWRLLDQAIRGQFPSVTIVAPGLVLGATDGRHYARVADAVYRFVPLVLRPQDLKRVHGIDERAGVADFARAVRVYHALLRWE